MNVKLKLTPELADDYVHFFDTNPMMIISTNTSVCVCWCSDDFAGKDFRRLKEKKTGL